MARALMKGISCERWPVFNGKDGDEAPAFWYPSGIAFLECSKAPATAAYPYYAEAAGIKNRKGQKGCTTDYNKHQPFWNNETNNADHNVPDMAQEV